MFSTSFWAVPALSRVEPARISGSDDDRDLVVDGLPERRPCDGDDRHGERACRSGGVDPAGHVGRAATRADADDHVGRPDAQVAHGAPTGVGVVLGGLLLRGGALQPACEQRDHLTRSRRKRRLALGCVERRQTAGRPRTDVDEAAALAESRGDRVDSRRDGSSGARNRRRDGGIFRAHELDELTGRAQVEIGAVGVTRLRDQPVE